MKCALAIAMSCAVACEDASSAAVMTSELARKLAPSSDAAPSVIIETRKDKMNSYPCRECHDESMPADNTERVLKEAHTDIVRSHGGAEFWCNTCHADDKDWLASVTGKPIDFDESHRLCGQCHFEQQRDALHGAHGKHLGSWRESKVAACTSCHDAHDPPFKPRKPYRGPDATR